MLALLSLLACQPASSSAPLTVLAAASLTDVVADIERAFEADNPGIDVRASFAGSQTLRVQIEQGAAADVFLSASREHLDSLSAAGHITDRAVFARSSLALVVPPDNPAGITGLDTLPRAERLVVGAGSVPIGQYTAALLNRAAADYGEGFPASVRSRVVSEEHSVRLARARVLLGEADAAIVYQTDTRAEGLLVVPIPAHLNITADYHIGLLTPPRAAAVRWADFLASPEGCAILAEHGFQVGVCG